MVEDLLAVWDQEPQLMRWQVKTWEHAALLPKSFGLTARVRDSKRILPEEITAPIYAALAEVEKNILRWTDPLPPFDARLLRTSDLKQTLGSDLSKQFVREDSTLTKTAFSEVVPGWEARVTEALGENLPEVERNIRNVASLGIPRDDFSIQYGYRIDLTLIPGKHADRRIETHRSLLMGCDHELLQPGLLRDFTDLLRS
jgi:hypothetical protein